jgi:hypothetical protein
MRRAVFTLFAAACLLACTLAHATIFGRVLGIVHDPQHRPVAGASVKLAGRHLRLVSDHANRRQR